ncbi:hypothetical protein GUJ93_ZPchr0012g19575 [Zizania palustris]|uniref:Uncharacterized protein n=1 Tax=Zizania palustris TaxID=103762 RepID=A0A8J5WMU8_ZIZPA|nr:hypothetical protein GUJ93_ZPchr0012g19575 [Zizania palustris]
MRWERERAFKNKPTFTPPSLLKGVARGCKAKGGRDPKESKETKGRDSDLPGEQQASKQSHTSSTRRTASAQPQQQQAQQAAEIVVGFGGGEGHEEEHLATSWNNKNQDELGKEFLLGG